MKRYFITGTDTDCGKTYATCCLVDALNKQGKTCLGIKPVASGCIEKNGELISADVEALQDCNPIKHPLINPWRMTAPVSPHLASHDLSAQAIAQYCMSEAFNDFEYLLIEGAGGLMVPLNDKETWVDVIKMASLPVILVVGMKLGCLNHAMLSVSLMKSKGIQCAGWIANCLDPDMSMLKENIATLDAFLDSPFLGKIPYNGGMVSGFQGRLCQINLE